MFYFIFCSLMFAFSHFVHYDLRQRALHSSRPSSSFPRLHSNDFSTQTPGFVAKNNRFSPFAHVNNGRWQCDHSYGSILMHQRVDPESLTFLFGSSIDFCAFVCCCRIAVYRPRRKKGRIKCDGEKRHSIIGEQKIDKKAGDVLRCDSDGDKNILSTPSVTNGLLSTRDPPLLDSATIAQLSLLDEPNAAAASQSKRRTPGHDSLVTISNKRCQGTTGRHGPWIQRSPSHTQRESSNAKFHCQWHERVVFCFGLLTRVMLIRLTTKFTTLISPFLLVMKLAYRVIFIFIYRPFRFSFLPCP